MNDRKVKEYLRFKLNNWFKSFDDEILLDKVKNNVIVTGGSIVNEHFETTNPGIFACGNCLQVYDTADILAENAKRTGIAAAEYIKNQLVKNENIIQIKPENNIQYIIPQNIQTSGLHTFTLRVKKPCGPVHLLIKSNNQILKKKKLQWVNPANMLQIQANIPKKIITEKKHIEVEIAE